MVNNLVLYGLVEGWACGYLEAKLTAYNRPTHVSTRYPTSGGSHVRVSAAGGSEQTEVTSNRTLIFECWGDTQPDAARLAELAYAILRAAPRDVTQSMVRHVETVGAPVYFPDPDGPPRYQFTVSVLIRGQVL